MSVFLAQVTWSAGPDAPEDPEPDAILGLFEDQSDALFECLTHYASNSGGAELAWKQAEAGNDLHAEGLDHDGFTVQYRVLDLEVQPAKHEPDPDPSPSGARELYKLFTADELRALVSAACKALYWRLEDDKLTQ